MCMTVSRVPPASERRLGFLPDCLEMNLYKILPGFYQCEPSSVTNTVADMFPLLNIHLSKRIGLCDNYSSKPLAGNIADPNLNKLTFFNHFFIIVIISGVACTMVNIY